MEKGEIKAATVHEIGCRFEDMLEAAKVDGARNEGAKVGLQAAAKKVLELQAHVDKDLDEGLFGDVDGPLAVAAQIKKYIARAVGVLESMSVTAENHRILTQGKVQAFQQMIDNMKKLHDMELEKTQAKQEAEATGKRRGRPTGVRPGMTIKEQRKLEEAPPPTKKTPTKPPPKKRGGRKKSAANT
jgi:hypothetical protein